MDPGDQDLDGAEEEEGEGEGEVARAEGKEGEPPEFSLEFEGDEEEEGEGEEEGEEGEGEEEEEVGMEPKTRKEWPEGRSNVVEAFFWEHGIGGKWEILETFANSLLLSQILREEGWQRCYQKVKNLKKKMKKEL